jgi:hypothetical protein
MRKRLIKNPLAQDLEIIGKGGTLTLQRTDGKQPDVIRLDPFSTEILSAYLLSVRQRVSGPVPSEKLGDKAQTVIEHVIEPAPTVRVTQKGARIDIGPGFWDNLYCELLLALPYMRRDALAAVPGMRH